MEKITPRVDIAFKKIFGVEENKDLLILLINSIVSAEDQISDVTLLNPYNAKNFKKDKLSILDIKAEGASGERFNIEIQISDEADYNKRALYYWAKLYTEQFSEDEKEGYESHLKWLRIQTNTIKKYEQHARAEGEAIGEARGEAIGEARGEAKRIKEKREIVTKMIKLGVATDIIIATTSLTREEVDAIKASIND